MDWSVISGFLSEGVIGFFQQTNWGSIALVWIIAQVINVETLAKILVKMVQKIPIVWLRKPLLVFFDKLAKAIDKEITEDLTK